VNHNYIIQSLHRNGAVFNQLFISVTDEERNFRYQPEKWSLLEILCHLYDEEREDFRSRVMQILETPELPLKKIDPVGWVTERKYSEKKYEDVLNQFLQERNNSVEWLMSLKNPEWNNEYVHPKFGGMKAEMILANWLAHDFLHFRQITRTRYEYLRQTSGTDINYAGNW